MNQKLNEYQKGYTQLISLARQVALLPVDRWLQELNHAENIAPFVDPTLYINYIYSDKPKILRKLMKASLELKRAYEEVEPKLMELFAKEIEDAVKAQESSQSGG